MAWFIKQIAANNQVELSETYRRFRPGCSDKRDRSVLVESRVARKQIGNHGVYVHGRDITTPCIQQMAG